MDVGRTEMRNSNKGRRKRGKEGYKKLRDICGIVRKPNPVYAF